MGFLRILDSLRHKFMKNKPLSTIKKRHMRMTLAGGCGQKRGGTLSARSVGTIVGVFRSTHSLGARINTTSDYPLHNSRCSKLTNSIEEIIGLQAKTGALYRWKLVY